MCSQRLQHMTCNAGKLRGGSASGTVGGRKEVMRLAVISRQDYAVTF